MSTVSFPSHVASASEPSLHESQYYTNFDPSSSFQMNPLSQHPPRTPRHSVVSTSSRMCAASIYEQKEAEAEDSEAEAESVGDEDDERTKEAERRVRREEVWREMIRTSDGRDKAFKLIQYSIKLYLLFHTSITGSRLLRKATRRAWEQEMVKRLSSTASGLSFTRKCLLLFNWLAPLTTVMAQQAVPFSSDHASETKSQVPKPFLHTLLNAPPPVLLELVNAISDDLYTLSLLGLLSKKSGDRAARLSDWCWLFATLIGLVENGVQRQMIGGLQHEVESRLYNESMSGATAKSKPKSSKADEKELARLQRQNYWLQISRAKLVMDLIFVSYDVFRIKRASTTVKTFTGLMAAILSALKLFDRHKTTLVKSVGATL